MLNRIALNQVYWPTDTAAQTDGKWQRLVQVVAATVFGSPYAWEITVKRHAKKRSVPANNYLWGVCYVAMSDASGYEKDELHEIMCGKFFGNKVIDIMGVKKRVPLRSTTTNEEGEEDTLSTAAFAEFVDFVIREAATWFEVVIPPPSPAEVPRG
jgi:hypothetical protein